RIEPAPQAGAVLRALGQTDLDSQHHQAGEHAADQVARVLAGDLRAGEARRKQQRQHRPQHNIEDPEQGLHAALPSMQDVATHLAVLTNQSPRTSGESAITPIVQKLLRTTPLGSYKGFVQYWS